MGKDLIAKSLVKEGDIYPPHRAFGNEDLPGGVRFLHTLPGLE